MHIEFIGLPGAGKTTLRKNLLSSLHEDGATQCVSLAEAFLEVSKVRMDKIFRYPLKFLPRSIALRLAEKLMNRSAAQFAAQNKFIAGHGAALQAFLKSDAYDHLSDLDKQRVIGNFLSTGALWQYTNTTSLAKKIIFFDEGLVQKSFMFVDHSQHQNQDKDNIHCYLQKIPRSDIVIYVSASIQSSWNRMRSRPDGLTDRLKLADEKTIGSFLEAAQAHLDVVKEWLLQNRNDSFLVWNSEDDGASEFDAIKDRIKQLIQ